MKTKKRPAPKSRPIANASFDFRGQDDVTGDKIIKQLWAADTDSSTVYRRSVPAPQAKTAIAEPKRKESNTPLGATHGNRACLGWVLNGERYAIQTRSYKMAKQLRRMTGAVLFADALDGPYMQTWLLPLRKESQGRQMVDYLLKTFAGESGASDRVQSDREGPAETPQNLSVGKTVGAPGVSPQRKARGTVKAGDIPDWDWEWIEERKPDAVGVEFCVMFPRDEGQWAVQIKDPRLIPCFSKRARTRLSGYSVGGWGQLRQYMVPCKSKAWARKIVLTALSTLPEFEVRKHKLQGAVR
jgi:hypothetical protein